MSDSLTSLDDLRRQHPDLGFGLYAFEPGGPVTLEVHTPDGGLFTWKAASEAEAIAQAFPPERPEADPAPEPPAGADIFS